ncbi:unnamed protein product [Peniophora sp. CBMAI 1063]|nr:unnamed protein product [Peniophora sp. CBMAI 1063]
MSRQAYPSSSGSRRPSQSGTRPLVISRPTRPTTPTSNGSVPQPLHGSPSNAPSRPDRSAYRAPRPPLDYPASDSPSYSRPPRERERQDSVSTTRSDASMPYPAHRNGGPTAAARPPRNRPNRSGTVGTVSSDGDGESPASLGNVLSAFAGASRKKTLDDEEWERMRQEELEAEQRRQKRIRDKVPGRRTNGRAKAGDIDAILDEIKDEWAYVTDPDFNPVELALQLLDDASSGQGMASFRQTKKMLSRALQGSVDKHYQAFAAALPHHASLVSHLTTTQGHIKDARTALQETKDALGNKRSDLVQLWTRNQTLEEMLRILDQIERLKLVPDVLESLMSEKRLLQASILLVRSLKTINKQDMLEIGAVADLRSYLVGQESALRDILLDELHSHLYLKSFWCENRWAPYTPNQQSLPPVEFEELPLPADFQRPPTPTTPTQAEPSKSSRLTRYIHDLTLRPNDPPHGLNEAESLAVSGGLSASSSIVNLNASTTSASLQTAALDTGEAPDVNPETDSFAYIETLLESLAVLGKLGSGLDVVAQRLPNEVFSLIEATVDEVGERLEYGRRASTNLSSSISGAVTQPHTTYVFASQTGIGTSSELPGGGLGRAKGQGFATSRLRLTALESSSKQVDHEILRDLFWTVYSKLDAVLQGLRVVSEVANRIGSRRDFHDTSGAKPGSLFPLSELWIPIQAEVRTLLYDYVTDEEQGRMSGRNPIASINDVLRDGRFNRDKSKHVFRFADTDVKLSNKSLRPHEDELTRVLRDTVPGLVQGSTETSVQATLSSVGTDERLLGIEQHHRLLIRPDAFHVSVLFQPMLAFLDRVSSILPSGFESARASRAVMEEFVLDVYLPQLEEKVSALFHGAVSGPEAFQPDPASSWLSTKPLVHASTQLMALINSLCTMLMTSPFHRDNYARFILTVIIQFYQRCSDRFQSLVATGESQLLGPDARVALAAQWAQNPEMITCLSQLLDCPPQADVKRRELCRQERDVETTLLADGVVEKDDLVHPSRNFASLGHLYRSVTWFASALSRLKTDAMPDEANPGSPMTAITATTPFFPVPPSTTRTSTSDIQLPLSREMAMRFHALLKTYEQLAEFIVYAMRMDVRARIIYYLDLAFRHGNYCPDREVGEPDPHIIDLNLELAELDDIVASTVPGTEQHFIFDGVGLLMDELLVSTARNIRKVNANGVKKIFRNMLALQQCIKTIVNDPRDTEFERAKQYWALFTLNPADMLDKVRQKQVFSFDEYKVMLDLQCGVDPTLGEKSASQAMDRNYSMYVIELHGMELEDKGEGL